MHRGQRLTKMSFKECRLGLEPREWIDRADYFGVRSLAEEETVIRETEQEIKSPFCRPLCSGEAYQESGGLFLSNPKSNQTNACLCPLQTSRVCTACHMSGRRVIDFTRGEQPGFFQCVCMCVQSFTCMHA